VLTSEDAYIAYSGELDARANRVWKELQTKLVALSSNSVRREIAGTTHESLVNSDRDAQATSAAIRQVVEAVAHRPAAGALTWRMCTRGTEQHPKALLGAPLNFL
jgi:hypothetical protein